MKRFICIIILILAYGVAFAGPQDISNSTATMITDRARVYLDEPSTASRKWNAAELIRFLNDGMVDIAAKSGAYQGSESISLVADTVEYTPTANYISLVAVVCNGADGSMWGLAKGNIRSVGEQISDDTPKYFYEFAGKIGVYPAYSSVTTEAVTVYYVKRPAVITSGDAVLTPAVFDKALVYYITAQALLKDKRPVEAANYLTLYQMEIDRYRSDFIGVDSETADPIR